jgi:hypothetical protein
VNIPANLTLNVLAYLTDSDETLSAKAQSQVNTVLRKVGEALGDRAWKELERKSGCPDGNKHTFIREAGSEFVKNATAKDRAKAERIAFEQLKTRRDELGGK